MLTYKAIEPRKAWLLDGRLMPGEELAQRWHIALRQLAGAGANGRLFSVNIEGRDWYLSTWREHSLDEVAAINHAFGSGVDATTKATFWWRKHSNLRGLSLHEALVDGIPLFTVLRAVHAFGAKCRGELYN